MLSIPNYIAPNPATHVRKLFTNFRSTNPTLLASIASVQTSTLLRNDFEQAVDALQSAVRTTNITISRKQRISALTNTVRGRVGRGERGGNGRFQRGKRGNEGGRRGRGGRGGSENKRVRFTKNGQPPVGIDWIEDKFYEPAYYSQFSAEQKSKLHELRKNRNGTPFTNQNISSLATRIPQLEQLTGQVKQLIIRPPQNIAPIGVQPQQNTTNAKNPVLQRLNQ